MKSWITACLALVSLLAFTSCSHSSELIAQGLKVELTRIERTSEGSVEVTWRVNNPNIVHYLVDRATLKITLDGALLGTVNEPTRIGVVQQSFEERRGTLMPASPAAAQRVVQLAEKGSARYELDATLWLLIVDDEKVKSSLSSSGTVPVSTK